MEHHQRSGVTCQVSCDPCESRQRTGVYGRRQGLEQTVSALWAPYDNGTGHRKTAVQGMADDNGDNP